MFFNAGFRRPRSIPEIYVGSRSVSSASFSWVSPIFFRLARTEAPNLILGSEFTPLYSALDWFCNMDYKSSQLFQGCLHSGSVLYTKGTALPANSGRG